MQSKDSTMAPVSDDRVALQIRGQIPIPEGQTVTVLRAHFVYLPSKIHSDAIFGAAFERIAFGGFFSANFPFSVRQCAISQQFQTNGPSVPADPFTLALTHKCCEISEGFSIQSTSDGASETKIVIVFIDGERYSPLCGDIMRASCVALVMYAIWEPLSNHCPLRLLGTCCLRVQCRAALRGSVHTSTNALTDPSSSSHRINKYGKIALAIASTI